MKQTVSRIYILAMVRIYKLFRGLRAWRACNDMILELERDYTISNNRVCKGSIKPTDAKVV